MERHQGADDRLADLNPKVDDGFARVDSDIPELRDEVKEFRREMHERFDSMQRAQYAGFTVIVAALIATQAL